MPADNSTIHTSLCAKAKKNNMFTVTGTVGGTSNLKFRLKGASVIKSAISGKLIPVETPLFLHVNSSVVKVTK